MEVGYSLTSACVSAAFRLAVTIQYASAEDAIYHIGPVCFWAYAEMTCGFIVVCLPCVPKIVMESGLWRRLRKGLGLKVTGVTGGATGGSGASGATPKNRTLSGTWKSKNTCSANDSYLEIDDTELKTFGYESTEHLRESTVPAGQLDKGIVRTTEVLVTDANGREGVFDRPTQWRYRGTN
ncbi:60s ribosomal protein l36 [Colletotrichum musicola]|uniref:60s ribosomal protein l36 n=1 Tax=Colletotrichum musicola TaxID=2175873 RepID=A0A8H6KPW2_9PEZI|nr:60s ribosomal protein l36 [Colletotrichum musicola]